MLAAPTPSPDLDDRTLLFGRPLWPVHDRAPSQSAPGNLTETPSGTDELTSERGSEAGSGTSTNHNPPLDRSLEATKARLAQRSALGSAFAKYLLKGDPRNPLYRYGHTPEQALRKLLVRVRRGEFQQLQTRAIALPEECDELDWCIVRAFEEWTALREATGQRVGQPYTSPFTNELGATLTGLRSTTFWRRWKKLESLGILEVVDHITCSGRSTRVWKLADAGLDAPPSDATVIGASRKCANCGGRCTSHRYSRSSRRKFCSDRCRVAAHRARQARLAAPALGGH
jgi:hypothetical protein